MSLYHPKKLKSRDKNVQINREMNERGTFLKINNSNASNKTISD